MSLTPLPPILDHRDYVLLRIVSPAVMTAGADLLHAHEIARHHPDLVSITELHPTYRPRSRALVKILPLGARLLDQYERRFVQRSN